MKCPECKLIEMFVKEVKDNIAIHECKKCGNTIKEELSKK